MARKIDQRAPAPAAESNSAADQLSVLNPDLTLTIAGREVTICEYGFFDGLEVAHRASAFIADMHNACRDGELRFDRIRRLFGKHREVVVDIAAQAASVEPVWVNELDRNDAEIFMSAWFGVTSGFFVHEVVMEMREERQLAAMQSTGSTSSPTSPPPDSATSTASGNSPSVN